MICRGCRPSGTDPPVAELPGFCTARLRAKQSFGDVRSQAELGNEMNDLQRFSGTDPPVAEFTGFLHRASSREAELRGRAFPSGAWERDAVCRRDSKTL